MGLFPRIIERLSPNRSSRRGAKIQASVVHTTESSDESFWGVVGYLSRHGVSASSHYVIDVDGPGATARVARLVPEAEKAWTVLSANPVTVNYELIGRARRSREEWLGKYQKQLRTLAALVADDVLEYSFPVRQAFPGVLGHVDLSRYGFPQTHWDPGPGFPWDKFLSMVRSSVVRPKPVVVNAKRQPRPKGVGIPRVIPPWAWQLRKWWLQGRPAHKRPAMAPRKVPAWFWHWHAWKSGILLER